MKLCVFCGQPAKAKSMCQKHYDRKRRTGDALTPDRQDEPWGNDECRKRMFHNAKRRAKQKGLDFTIHADDVIIPEFCPVLGIKLKRGERNFVDSSPSLDRINSKLGYVPGNVRVISWRANRIKNDSTAEELEKILRYINEQAME